MTASYQLKIMLLFWKISNHSWLKISKLKTRKEIMGKISLSLWTKNLLQLNQKFHFPRDILSIWPKSTWRNKTWKNSWEWSPQKRTPTNLNISTSKTRKLQSEFSEVRIMKALLSVFYCVIKYHLHAVLSIRNKSKC